LRKKLLQGFNHFPLILDTQRERFSDSDNFAFFFFFFYQKVLAVSVHIFVSPFPNLCIFVELCFQTSNSFELGMINHVRLAKFLDHWIKVSSILRNAKLEQFIKGKPYAVPTANNTNHYIVAVKEQHRWILNAQLNKG